MPETALKLDVFEVLEILRSKIGTVGLQNALNPAYTIESPLKFETNTEWLKKAKMVGINVRTIQHFFNVVKYSLTLPDFHHSIHLLPIWEPGVVGSLYGMASWNINPEFFSEELHRAVPSLDTVEKQLKVTINILHALGKRVGMDVIPHTDRFSEMVLQYPRYFEWVKRLGGQIQSQSEFIYKDVEEIIWHYLGRNGTGDGSPLSYTKATLFNPEIPILTDQQRALILFGPVGNYARRQQRRIAMIQDLINQGFETLPMTMAPPYRGLGINADDYQLDQHGNKWYNYSFTKPEGMSRVFGPLTRYKFYYNEPQSCFLDFNKPQTGLWHYLAEKFLAIQQNYQIDFMRGDMSHVQPRPNGVPAQPDRFYDPLGYIKTHINSHVPYFGYFAESFLAEPNTMLYGVEEDHLEASKADTTLGDLQSTEVGSNEFKEKISKFIRLNNRSFKPNFTVITADKDDPRFDAFFKHGNLFRYFVAVFCAEWPSYYSLGFESRAENTERNLNETYSKLYVFNISDPAEKDKVTSGPFQWGKNTSHFGNILKIRSLAEVILPEIVDLNHAWIAAPPADWWLWEQGPYIFSAKMTQENIAQPEVLGNIILEIEEKEHIVRVYRK